MKILRYLSIAFLLVNHPQAHCAGDVLTMGVFPRHNHDITIEMFSPLAEYLSHKIGKEIKLESENSFAAFWKNVSEQHYDIIHFNQYHYIKANKYFRYTAILKNEESGESTAMGIILVRRDSGIKTLEDLKGKQIIFGGGQDAFLSYIVPHYLLRQAGLVGGDYVEKIAINPPNAAIALYFHQVAAVGVGSSVSESPYIKKQIDLSELTPVAQSEIFPHLPWAVSTQLNGPLSKTIQDALADMHNTESGRRALKVAGLTGLVRTSDSEYNAVRKFIKETLGEDYL